MSLVSEKLYDAKAPLFFSRDTRLDGRNYKKGDEAPTKDMSQRTIMKFFRTGLFVHQVRKHQSEREEIKDEVKVEDPVPAKPRRGRGKKQPEE